MDEKKLHTREFQLKGSGGNMRCKLLQKRFTGKTTECSKHLCHIAIEKDILSELNRSIFQISLKYIKLVIPKILSILVLCSFNFYFKITWPPLNKQQINVSLTWVYVIKWMKTKVWWELFFMVNDTVKSKILKFSYTSTT